MDALTAVARAAARLAEEQEALARAVTAAMYAERPALLERWGEAGREKCLQDLRYTIEHLSPAVELGAPELFVRYARWLDELLRARGVPTRDVRRSFELLASLARQRMPADEAALVASVLDAGRAVLTEREG
jgi:hypothetical protein